MSGLLYYIVIYLCVVSIEGEISNQRLCGDPKCSDAVSYAKTLLRYSSDDVRILSFPQNVEAKVFSKSAGSRMDLWGVEIGGKRGYAPQSMLREHKVLIRKLEYVVETEDTPSNEANENAAPLSPISNMVDTKTNPLTYPSGGVSAESTESETTTPLPSEIRRPYEIHDGTTFFITPSGSDSPEPGPPQIQASTTDSSLNPSAVVDTKPVQMDEPNVSMMLPSAATSSGYKEAETVAPLPVQEEVEGSSKGIYDYISSFLPGDGSGFEKPVEESLEEYEDDDEDDDEGDDEGDDEVDDQDLTAKGSELEVGENSYRVDSISNEVDPGTLMVEESVQKPTSDSVVETKESAREVETTASTGEVETTSSTGEVEIIASGGQVETKESTGEVETKAGVEVDTKESTGEVETTTSIGEVDTKESTSEVETTASTGEVDTKESTGEVETNLPTGEDDTKKLMNEELSQNDMNQAVENEVLLNESNKKESETAKEETEQASKEASEAASENKLAEKVAEVLLPTSNVLTDDTQLETEKLTEKNELIDEAVNDNIESMEQLQAINVGGGSGVQSEETVKEVILETDQNNVIEVQHNSEAQAQQSGHENVGTESYDREADSVDKSEKEPSVTDSVLTETFPLPVEPSTESINTLEVPSIQHAAGLQIESNNHSNTSEESDIDSKPLYLESGEIVPEILAEHNAGDLSGNELPPARSIFDFMLNRDTRAEDIVAATDAPQTTDSNQPNQQDYNQVEESTNVIPDIAQTIDTNIDSSDAKEKPVEITLETVIVNDQTTSVNESRESELIVERNEDLPASIDSNPADDGPSFFSSLTSFITNIPSFFTSPSTELNPPESLDVDSKTDSVAVETASQQVFNEDDKHADKLSSWLSSNTGAASECNGEFANTEECFSILPSLTTEATEQMGSITDLEYSNPTYSFIITAVTILLFTLGFYFIEKSRRDSYFIAKINRLEKELFTTSVECNLAKENLEATKGQLDSEQSSLANNESVSDELYAELQEAKSTCAEFEEQVRTLQVELEAATEAGLEVNRMLSEVLSSQNGTQSLLESVENLQSQLNSQQGTIAKMSDLIALKNQEIETLRAQVADLDSRNKWLSTELTTLTSSFNDLLGMKEKREAELELKNFKLVEEIADVRAIYATERDAMDKRIIFFEDSVDYLEGTLDIRNGELAVMKEAVMSMGMGSSGDGAGEATLEAMLDVGRARAQIERLTKENDKLSDQLNDEATARKLLEDHQAVIEVELSTLKEDILAVDASRLESDTKLKVLTSYFEAKESELQKAVNKQEAMAVLQSGDVQSIQSELTAAMEKNDFLQTQAGDLRQEILDQQRSFKDQILALENKVHETWVASRQHERKLEETKVEAATLRTRLTTAERELSATNQQLLIAQQYIPLVQHVDQMQLSDNRLAVDMNGELPTSPLHMGRVDLTMYPPFPLSHPGGIPFMPPPTYPQDRRPPPLGGILTSPPLLPPPVPGHYPRHYDRHSPDRHSPNRQAFRGRPQPTAGFRPLPPTANKSKGSNAGSSHSSESLDASGV